MARAVQGDRVSGGDDLSRRGRMARDLLGLRDVVCAYPGERFAEDLLPPLVRRRCQSLC